MRRIGLAAAMVLAGVLATPSGAAGDDTEAVRIEVERALDRLARLDPAQGLEYGAIEVLPDGGAYRVAVADVAVKLAANDPGHLDVGFVSFRLSPQDGNLYRVDRVELADEIAHQRADGRTDGVWALTHRRLAGLWSRRQGGFLRRGVAVDASLAVSGLDAVIDGVAAAPQSGSGYRWLQLMLFRGLARRDIAADGTVLDHYDLQVRPDGFVVVNGRAFDTRSAASLSVQ